MHLLKFRMLTKKSLHGITRASKAQYFLLNTFNLNTSLRPNTIYCGHEPEQHRSSYWTPAHSLYSCLNQWYISSSFYQFQLLKVAYPVMYSITRIQAGLRNEDETNYRNYVLMGNIITADSKIFIDYMWPNLQKPGTIQHLQNWDFCIMVI